MTTDLGKKVVALVELQEQRAAVLVVIGETAASGDTKKMDLAFTERRKLDKQIADFAATAEKSARDQAIPQIQNSLEQIDMKMSGAIMPGVVLSGTLTRGENDMFDDLKIGVAFAGDADLSQIFYDALDVSSIADLKSVKGISFTIGRDSVTITYTGRAPASGSSGGNGTGGKGWFKEGTKFSLTDVFEAYASDEDRQKLAAVSEDGNKAYSVKLTVAKKQTEYVLGV